MATLIRKEGIVAIQIWPSVREKIKQYKEDGDFDNMSEALLDLFKKIEPK